MFNGMGLGAWGIWPILHNFFDQYPVQSQGFDDLNDPNSHSHSSSTSLPINLSPKTVLFPFSDYCIVIPNSTI